MGGVVVAAMTSVVAAWFRPDPRPGDQRHTVRGRISGALKKKLGLGIVSQKTARGRCYRIGESRPAAP
jgi:hypothetical protein